MCFILYKSDLAGFAGTLMVLLIFMIIAHTPLSAEEKNNYRYIMVLGVDKPVSSAKVNNSSPVIACYYTRDDLPDNLYFQFRLTTTTLYTIIGIRTGSWFIGIKPVLNHTVYGAYHSYTDGVNNDSRCFKGNNTGAEFFYEYSPLKYLKGSFYYYPGYYWYNNKKKSESVFTKQDATVIDLPENHLEQTGTFDLIFGNIEKKDLNRIRHGYFIQGTYKFSYRSGYGTFYDTGAAQNSSENKTHKRYFVSGLYFNSAHDVNLLLDLYGAYQTNTDRNNSDQIGSYITENGIMPGYFWGEFYHNKYVIARSQAGIPLFFWSARLQPGFNILYLAEDNGVTGAGNYPRRTYRSVSMELSFRAGNILPLFFNYAYGFDAKRLNTSTGEVKKGNHELMFYTLAAF